MNPIWDEKRNGSLMVIVKWPRWPPCSKMLKASKDLLQNSWANCLETGYVASLTVVLQNLYKKSSWVDLNLIYGRSVFCSICIFNRKSWNNYFLLLLYSRIWKWSELYHKWMLKVKVILGLSLLEPVTWQVSVYRINGPLVCICEKKGADQLRDHRLWICNSSTA